LLQPITAYVDHVTFWRRQSQQCTTYDNVNRQLTPPILENLQNYFMMEPRTAIIIFWLAQK